MQLHSQILTDSLTDNVASMTCTSCTNAAKSSNYLTLNLSTCARRQFGFVALLRVVSPFSGRRATGTTTTRPNANYHCGVNILSSTLSKSSLSSLIPTRYCRIAQAHFSCARTHSFQHTNAIPFCFTSVRDLFHCASSHNLRLCHHGVRACRSLGNSFISHNTRC